MSARTLRLVLCALALGAACKRGAEPGAPAAPGAAPAAPSAEVGDRLHFAAPPLSEADLAAFPVPAPVATVARAGDIPRLPPLAAAAQPQASSANQAVKLALLGHTRSRTLPGLTAPAGQEFLVLHTRWENALPRKKVRRGDLEGRGDRTMGVQGFAAGAAAGGGDDTLVEADVAYQVPKLEDHAWLLADGTAHPLSPLTVRLHPGAPYGRPFQLARLGDSAELQLAYLVPEGSQHLALRFFDYAYGHVSLPVAGAPEKAGGDGALPAGALAHARGGPLELAVVKVTERSTSHGVTAPEGWRFVAVQVVGKSHAKRGAIADIVQLDPRRLTWVHTTAGQLRYASGGSVGAHGLLRFPPELAQRHELVFLVPSGEAVSRLGVRTGSEVLELALGEAVRLPAALATARDAHLDVAVLGLWRSDTETVLDVAVKNLEAGRGFELEPRQLALVAGEKALPPDEVRTRTLLRRPPSPFVLPPAGTARFSLSYPGAEPARALRISGVAGDFEVPLAGVQEAVEAPRRGGSTLAADDLVLREAVLPEASEAPEPEPAWSSTAGEPMVLASPEVPRLPPAEPPNPFPDDREPNDTWQTASPLGDDGIAHGQLTGPNDRDTYRFNVTGAPALWRLEAEGGDVLRLTYSGRGYFRSQEVPAKEGRVQQRDLYLLPGEHYVSVEGRPRGEGPQTYALRLVSEGARAADYEAEPNGSEVLAMALLPGERRRGRIAHEGDLDLYHFSLARAEHLSVALEAPPDTALRFELKGPTGSGAGAGESVTPGARIRWAGWFAPGDYVLTVRARSASLQPYTLQLERLDPFVTWGDLEPNDSLESAATLAQDLLVQGGASTPLDRDVYRLPAVDAAQTLTLAPHGEVRELAVHGADHSRLQLTQAPAGTLQVQLPAGKATFLVVTAAGEYSVALALERGPAAQRAALLPVSLTLPAPGAPFAAWWSAPQRRELALTLENPGAQAQALTLRTWSSHPAWRASVPASVSVPAKGRVQVPLRVDVAADAWSGRPVRVAVEARAASGARRVASVELGAECGLPPSDVQRPGVLPAGMLGGWDVASLALGGRGVPSDRTEQQRLEQLLTGVVTLDQDAQFPTARLPLELTVDLAGETAVPVAGVLLHPPARAEYASARDFDVLLSEDGQHFTQVLSGALAAEPVEQAFALERPVPARFARLRLRSAHGDRPSWLALNAFKVVAAPGTVPAPARGLNLAEPRLGGQVVWADPALPNPRAMLSEEAERASFRTDPTRPLRWVLGFQHQRAARLRALEWQEDPAVLGKPGMRAVQVAVSTASPFGPWEPVGTWKLAHDAQGLARLELREPLWARYVQLTNTEAAEAEYWRLPDTVRVLEQAEEAQYRSVIGEWGGSTREASFEQLTPAPRPPELAHVAAHDSRERARALGAGVLHHDQVERGRDLDWYRLVVPDGHNTVRLQLEAQPLSRLDWRLEAEDGTEVPLKEESREAARLVLGASVKPGATYFLKVEEPLRSIVFAWDASGSVARFQPQIFNAMRRFAAKVSPGLERVHLLPLQEGTPQPLLPEWGADSHALQQAINDYDERHTSSNAEGNLLAASELLGAAKGSRAVLIVTDDDSGASWREESALWASLEGVRPRIFAVQIPLSSSAALFQDRMQSWAEVADGHYAAFRTREDVDLAFDRASCLLRRPAPYGLQVDTSFREPPRPGRLEVARKGPAPDGTAFEIILDASGSMHRKLGDRSRIDVAREVLGGLVSKTLPPATPVALRAFGHQRPRACHTDLVVPLRPLDRAQMARIIQRIQPQDRAGTPLAASLREVAKDLERAGKRKVVVLVTDGEESCGGDPAAVIQELKETGLDVRLNIVGFALDEGVAHGDFERWASLGGGRYYNARSAEELSRALEQALNPLFQVQTGSGEVLATGTVNGAPVEVAPGEYTVRVLSTPPAVYERVKVESAKVQRLSLEGR